MTREELEQQLRKLIVGCPGGLQDTCPFCHCNCDDDVAAAMALIDRYAAGPADTPAEPVEEWDAVQAAEYLGYRDAAAARSALSRWGIQKVREKQADGGRMMSLYPAEAIRAEAARRGRRA